MMTANQKEKIVNLLKLYECFGVKYMEPLSLNKGNLERSELLPTDFKSLNEYIQHCNLCTLSKSCNKTVGLNNHKGKIYIVGVNYDFNDINIQNSVNHFFRNIMEQDFNKIYMTNIIKCDTQNINVDSESISLCKEYFFQELAIGKPKYIFATLEVCKYILKIDVVDKSFVGKSYKLGEYTVFPIFDFNFLSKNPSYKEEMERVFKKIKGLIC